MECHYSNNDKATASGGADAPIPRSQGIGGKTLTGQKKEIPRLLTPKSKLRLGSWNVRTAFHCGQKEIIARELSKCRVTVAALSELRISGCGTTRVQVPATDDWMTLYYSGGQEHRDGVGFMLNSHASKCVVSFQPISPRIAVITLGGTVKSHIVSVYAPTEPSDDARPYVQCDDDEAAFGDKCLTIKGLGPFDNHDKGCGEKHQFHKLQNVMEQNWFSTWIFQVGQEKILYIVGEVTYA
ncbi:hypothetical protein OSTOST_00482 [Ostertagia ostertagi]